MKNNLTEKNIRDFLRYNNAVPLFVALAVVISGSAFAATSDGQQAINNTLVGKTSKVITVDNTYIATLDLNSFTPKVRVTAVSEDSDFYYVTYILSTVNVKDYVWQNVNEENILKVDKNFLKEFKSLEDYVKYELSQKLDAEKDRLSRTQEIEKKNITVKQTVTSYTGLVGIVLDETTVVEDPFAPAPASLTPGLPPVPAQQVTQNNQQTENLNNNNQQNNSTSTSTSTSTAIIDTSILNATTTTPVSTTTEAITGEQTNATTTTEVTTQETQVQQVTETNASNNVTTDNSNNSNTNEATPQ